MVVADQDVGAPAASTMTKLPFGLEFDVFRLVAFFQQAMHAFQHYEVLVCAEAARLPLIDDESLSFGVEDLLLAEVDFNLGLSEALEVRLPLVGEPERLQKVRQVVFGNHESWLL